MKAAVMMYAKTLSESLSKGAEENHERPSS